MCFSQIDKNVLQNVLLIVLHFWEECNNDYGAWSRMTVIRGNEGRMRIKSTFIINQVKIEKNREKRERK